MNIKNEHMEMVQKIYYKYFNKYSSLKDDLLQEGYLALCECYIKNNNDNTFNRYLYIRVKGAMINLIRKELNYRKYFSESVDKEIFDGLTLLDTLPTFDAYNVVIKEFLDHVERNHNKLYDVALLILQDIPQTDVAVILNISVRTVKNYVKKLKEVYKIYTGGELNGN